MSQFPPVPGAVANLRGLKLVATTGMAGYALVNGTGNVPGLTWTAPNDGQLHRVMALGAVNITSALTGGLVRLHFVTPNGATANGTVLSGGEGASSFTLGPVAAVMQPGSQAFVAQDSAASLGAAVAWFELWAL